MSKQAALQGRIAVVTGGASGIGLAIVRRFAQEGATVVLCDLEEALAASAAEQLRDSGLDVTSARLDVRVANEAQRLATFVSEQHGKLDILVNNAGVVRDAAIHKMSDADWTIVHDVVSTGAFNLCRAFAALLRNVPADSHHRKVINMASVSGVYGRELSANYCAAKAGLIGLTKALAREWAPRQINVNAIAPGFIGGTKLTTPVDSGKTAMSQEFLNRVIEQIPIGRGGTPDDVAGLATFLASPDSDYVSGQVIEIHGGLEILKV